jgi:hypothetical protein
MFAKKLDNFDIKIKLYFVLGCFIFVAIQTVATLIFINHIISSITKTKIDLLNQKSSISSQYQQIYQNKMEFERLLKVWSSIDKSKIEQSSHSVNDIVVLLTSKAKQYGMSNFTSSIGDIQEKGFYKIVKIKTAFNAFYEPSIFALVDDIKTSANYSIFIQKLVVKKLIEDNDLKTGQDNKSTNLDQVISLVAQNRYQKQLDKKMLELLSGEKHYQLPSLLSCEIEFEILLVNQ